MLTPPRFPEAAVAVAAQALHQEKFFSAATLACFLQSATPLKSMRARLLQRGVFPSLRSQA